MNISKYIQILVLGLFPTCLIGMNRGAWLEEDKLENTVCLEWHKVNTFETFLDWEKALTPAIAEAFADEPIDLKNFLLDDKLQPKQENVKLAMELSYAEQKELAAKIAVSCSDRTTRVEFIKQRFYDQLEMARMQLFLNPRKPGKSFIVIAKNEADEVLGFAIFRFLRHDVAALELLGVIPCAQGRGLSRFLALSILKLASETKHIVVATEIWNTKAQAAYQAIGFTVDKQDDCYVSFEYEVKS